ncbi:MAG: alpha-L-fucosidase [Planctomycetaceae bacterium]|jgi:alpha-L-fucosidase|nr:alpha-L-fucosidase [Planctomycetaceae bacterium]
MTRFFVSLFVFTVIVCSSFAQDAVQREKERDLRLPPDDTHYRVAQPYVEEKIDSDYVHASPEAYEAFRDIKYSVRIHWGVYAMWNLEASWPWISSGMSNEKKQAYQNLYKEFNPTEFDADEWMEFFKRCGMQAFAFTSKHTDGFSMFHTKTRVKQRVNYLQPQEKMIEQCDLSYSIEESPFKRDIVKELCDAGHKHGIKIDLYYPNPDWYDADFRPFSHHPLTTERSKANKDNEFGTYNTKSGFPYIMSPEPTKEEHDRMMTRYREQLRELLTNYGKIDMVCLDEWLGKDVWQQHKETVKMMRQLQPDVMIRNRGIGNYGDYYQPEQVVPGGKKNSNMPWMSICLLGKIFAYDPKAENYKGAGWVIHNLIDCVAKGGSFMVCIGPDAKGKFHPTAVKQLEEVGDWLKVNGQGIYETRSREVWKENRKEGNIKFTRSKDNKTVYAFVEKFPEKELAIESVNVKDGSEVRLLGYDKVLQWHKADKGIVITIPDGLQRPCNYAWAFRLEQAD